VDLAVVLPCFFVGALLYTSVGHGGATIYLAILTLAGAATGPLVTTVLVLNVLAAAIAFGNFGGAGHLRLRLLLPFVVTSVPAAYLGGSVPMKGPVEQAVLGGALLLGAIRLLFFARPPNLHVAQEGAAFRVGAPLLGAALGFLAGATGIGGGIFLSPVLLLLGWATVRETGAISSAFIVVNSVAGLVARLPRSPVDPSTLAPLAAVVVVGAAVGSFVGARRIPPRALQVLLGVVLLVAAGKALL
jgi:uncharacterized membrane protein YfcA